MQEPSCGWEYRCPQTGFVVYVEEGGLPMLKDYVTKHLIANGHEIPVDLGLLIEDHIAGRIDPSFSYDPKKESA